MGAVVGIDPGKKGGIAILKDGEVSGLEMPLTEDSIDINKLILLFTEWKDLIDYIYIEKQQAMSGQGVTSTFTTAYNFGLIVGILYGLGIKVEIVSPKQWQKVYLKEVVMEELKHIPTSKMKESKKRSISACRRLFPDLIIQSKRGRWLDGIADAVLIALHKVEV